MKIISQSAQLIGLMLPVEFYDGEVYLHENATIFDDLRNGVFAAKGAPEKLIEAAGRTCYKSEGLITADSYQGFVNKVCNQLGHESVSEHSSASFRVICDRGVSHELVRHRLASYSQESTRYCNYGKDKYGAEITVIKPPLPSQEAEEAWHRSVDLAEAAYLRMLETGCTPQIARSVLPTCLKTEIVMTANFREWKHFLKLRTSSAAHPQMREVAELIRDILVQVAPTLFAEFKKETK